MPDGWKQDERKRGKKTKPDKMETKANQPRGRKSSHHSELAGDLRETENKFEQMTEYRLKMV